MLARWLCLVGLGLSLFAAKLLLISRYGVAMPLHDQWWEANLVFKPWMEGRLNASMLLSNSNVHHILMTRLLDLAELKLNSGVLDPITQMIINAALHAAVCVTLVAILGSTLGTPVGGASAIYLLLAVGFPFAWRNTLWGYQSQFYFLVGTAIVTLWGLSSDRPSTLRWWAGAVAGLVGCWTSAGGLVAPAVMLTLVAFEVLTRQRSFGAAFPTLTAAFIGALMGVGLFLQGLFHSQPASAKTLAAAHVGMFARLIHFVSDTLAVIGWPLPVWLFVVGAVLIYLPFACWLWLEAPRLDVHSRVLAGFGLWALAEAGGVAMLRGVPPESRHLDLLIFGPLANLAALTLMRKRWPAPLSAFWLIVLCGGLISAGSRAAGELADWGRQMPGYVSAVQRFLATDDASILQAHPAPVIHQPKANKLAAALRDPTIRGMLSPDLLPAQEWRRSQMTLSALVRPFASRSAILTIIAAAMGCWMGSAILFWRRKTQPA